MIGKTFEQFKIIRELGRGGLGVVYLAEDIKLERRVALKFLKSANVSREKILTEARAVSHLNHKGIVTIHDVIDTSEGPAIVMEYIEGESLEEYLKISKPSLQTTIKLAIEILEIISFAHKKNLIHGDLKPANIFIDNEGKPKLVDFGLSRIVNKDPGNSNSSGTFPYMAPEIIMGMPASFQSDLYSFGVIFYQMLTREIPVSTGKPGSANLFFRYRKTDKSDGIREIDATGNCRYRFKMS